MSEGERIEQQFRAMKTLIEQQGSEVVTAFFLRRVARRLEIIQWLLVFGLLLLATRLYR